MISISQAPRNGGAWALRAALIGSLLVHLAIFVAGTAGYDEIARAFNDAPAAAAATPPADEIVTITTPLALEHQTVPSQPQHVASVEVPEGFGFPRTHETATQRAFERQKAAFEKALARNAYGATAANDPAKVPQKYRLSMQGKNAKLKRGQGIYFPTRGWRENGFDYYDVAYEFVYSNGTDEKGTVPWPIHFDPSSDPFFSPNFEALSQTPLPAPPAGFTPPGDLGKALRAYFPNLHFEDSDG